MKVHYEAFDSAGNLIGGEVDAETLEAARDIIWSRGATPLVLRQPTRTGALLHNMTFFRRSRKPKDPQLARLTRDLAVLLQAGLPLESALRIAPAATDAPHMQRLSADLLDGVLKGSALANVMEQMDGTFRVEYVRIVQAGELSGDLGGAMLELADLIDRRVEIRTKIRSSMAYPVLLVCLAAISLWVVLGLLLPAVTPIFLENGKPLPGVIATLDTVRQNALPILTGGASLVIVLLAARAAARRQPPLRKKLDRLYLKIPLIGPISGLREAGRLTRTLATLIRAGVPLLQALETVAPRVQNNDTRDRFQRAVDDVREGMSLAGALSKWSALPPVARQIITVGEESGRLQEMIMRAAIILERQEQMRTAKILAVLTPAITILVAGLVAAIILSVITAILSINDLVLS